MGYDIADIDGNGNDVDITLNGGQRGDVGTAIAKLKAVEFARGMIIEVQEFLREGNDDNFRVQYIEWGTGLMNSKQVAENKAKFEAEGMEFPANPFF